MSGSYCDGDFQKCYIKEVLAKMFAPNVLVEGVRLPNSRHAHYNVLDQMENCEANFWRKAIHVLYK